MMASITNTNKPKVMMVSGNVRKKRIGRTKTLAIPIIKLAINAVPNPRMRNPGTRAAVKNNASPETNQCMRSHTKL
jgi:hypothetical protein